MVSCLCHKFFYIQTTTSHLCTLSLHDALPISLIGSTPVRSARLTPRALVAGEPVWVVGLGGDSQLHARRTDRKSTRLNSSHRCISYAVFCLKKKKMITRHEINTFLLIMQISIS